MKKTFLLIAVLCVSAMSNAQLRLIKSFDDRVKPSTIGSSSIDYGDWQFPAQYVYSSSYNGDKTVINFYDGITLDFYKSVTINGQTNEGIIAASKNFFSTDGKLMFMTYQNHKYVLFDENGNLVQTFLGSSYIYKNLNGYVFVTFGEDPKKTEFYAIPGDIDPTAITNTPAQSPWAIRKSIRKGLITIDTPKQTYSISGQMIEPIH